MELTHLNEHGEAAMVDISGKPASLRMAEAYASVSRQSSRLETIMDGAAPKGDGLARARLAGSMAAKRTA